MFPAAPAFPSDMPAPEIRSLTGLRALPALLVVFYHFYREHIPASIPVLHEVVGAGFTAVGMFFVLSGFILTYVYAGHDLRERAVRRAFWIARFARVYPVYLLSLAIGFAAQLPKSGQSLATGMGWVRLALALSLLNAASHYGMFVLNWAAWSLSVEAVFYLLFPSLAPSARSGVSAHRSRGESARSLGSVGSWRLRCTPTSTPITSATPPAATRRGACGNWYLKLLSRDVHVECFVIGIVAGCSISVAAGGPRARAAREAELRRSERSCSILVGAVRFASSFPHAYLYTRRAPFRSITLLVVARLTPGRTRSTARDPRSTSFVVALGRASYAIYILHVPVFYLCAHFIPSMWDEGALFWPYLGALLIVSSLVYGFVEEPRLDDGCGAR